MVTGCNGEENHSWFLKTQGHVKSMGILCWDTPAALYHAHNSASICEHSRRTWQGSSMVSFSAQWTQLCQKRAFLCTGIKQLTYQDKRQQHPYLAWLMLHLHPCPDSIHPASRRGLQPLSSTQLRAALHSPSNVHCHRLVAAGQPVLVLQHGRKHGGSNAHRNGSLNALNRIEENVSYLHHLHRDSCIRSYQIFSEDLAYKSDCTSVLAACFLKHIFFPGKVKSDGSQWISIKSFWEFFLSVLGYCPRYALGLLGSEKNQSCFCCIAVFSPKCTSVLISPAPGNQFVCTRKTHAWASLFISSMCRIYS